ncbi:polyadenylate-binding protein 1-like protein, partial [Reticulomyxa filosa]
IENLNDHLNGSCSLKLEECWFKSFGCNCLYSKHELENDYVLKMKYHFDLVMTKFGSMQQTINQLQEETRRLRLENVKLKAEMEINGKIQYENVILKQQLLQTTTTTTIYSDKQINKYIISNREKFSMKFAKLNPSKNDDVTVRIADNTIVQSGVISNKELNAPTGIKSIMQSNLSHPFSSQLSSTMREAQPLTPQMLNNATAQERKRMIGERLFPKIQLVEPRLTGKITGMLLQMENTELLVLLNNEGQLRNKINEALSVLKEHHKKRSLRNYNKIRPQND